MDIIDVLKKYKPAKQDVEKVLIDFGTSRKFLMKIPLNDIDEEVVTKMLLHWIVYKGLEAHSYVTYFKDWDKKEVTQVDFRKKSRKIQRMPVHCR